MTEYKIYCLSDPDTDVIFYVGCTYKTLQERVRGSYAAPSVRTIRNRGQQPKIELLDTCSGKDAKALENYWMEQFKVWGISLENKMPSTIQKPHVDKKVRAIKGEKWSEERIYHEAALLKPFLNEAMVDASYDYTGICGLDNIVNGKKIKDATLCQVLIEFAHEFLKGKVDMTYTYTNNYENIRFADYIRYIPSSSFVKKPSYTITPTKKMKMAAPLMLQALIEVRDYLKSTGGYDIAKLNEVISTAA